MTDKNRKRHFRKSSVLVVSYALMAGCLLVAFDGYRLHPPKNEKNPPHILMFSNGGTVLFPHHFHSSEDGPALVCSDCHHTSSSGSQAVDSMRCRSCHYNDPDVVAAVCSDNLTHPRCIGKKCMDCHDGEDCTFCHRKKP